MIALRDVLATRMSEDQKTPGGWVVSTAASTLRLRAATTVRRVSLMMCWACWMFGPDVLGSVVVHCFSIAVAVWWCSRLAVAVAAQEEAAHWVEAVAAAAQRQRRAPSPLQASSLPPPAQQSRTTRAADDSYWHTDDKGKIWQMSPAGYSGGGGQESSLPLPPSATKRRSSIEPSSVTGIRC